MYADENVIKIKHAVLREVAKLAGVSPATVSRVMNGTANVDDDKKIDVMISKIELGNNKKAEINSPLFRLAIPVRQNAF